MNYWPMSAVIESPMLQPSSAHMLKNMFVSPVPEYVYNEAAGVALMIREISMPNLAVIESIDAPYRLAYTGQPSLLEFQKLERACVLQALDGRVFIVLSPTH